MRRGIELVPRLSAAGFLIASALVAAAQADDVSSSRLRDLDLAQHDYVDRSPVFSSTAREQARVLIEPALRAALTSRDWLANRDPGMAAIAADLKAR